MSVRNITTTLELKSIMAIATVVLVTTAGVGGAALGVGPLGGQETAVAQQESPLETAVTLEPNSATVTSGETTTYDVVVDTANGGVGAYDFTVSIADPSIASVSDVAVNGSPSEQTTDVSIADDGSSTDVTAALANTSDSGSVTIATVTVAGDAAGTSDVELAVEALGTEAGESYTVTETTGASITVEADEPEPEPEPDPASFQVSNLDAPDTATQGDAVDGSIFDVSADVTNDGDEEGTQTVEFRLDLDGDDTLEEDETLASQNVTLDGGETQTVTFEDIDASGLDVGDYTHGVFTDDDSATATIAIEAADDDDDDDGDDDETVRETAVSLQPSDSTVTVGESTTYDVVVETADGGVGAYEFTVTLDDPSVASATDLELGGDPSAETSNVTLADDGSSASATAALANTSDTGSVTIATVTVTGDAAGTSDLSLALDALGTEAGESYTVTETTGASITVEADDDGGDGDDGEDGDDGDDGDDGEDGDDGDDGEDGDDGDAEEFTLDEIAQAKYGHDFANLSTETSGEVQAIYNRQPFPDGTEPSDIRTRDEITNDRHGYDFSEVSRETTIEIQNDYDAQFGPLPSDPAFTLDEIAQAKYGHDFANLSTETSGEVQAIYNRQPFPDGTEPADIRTRDEITNDRHGYDFSEVSRETTIEIQNDYDAQFEADS